MIRFRVILTKTFPLIIFVSLLAGTFQVLISTNNALMTIYWVLIWTQLTIFAHQKLSKIDQNNWIVDSIVRLGDELLAPLIYPIRNIPIYLHLSSIYGFALILTRVLDFTMIDGTRSFSSTSYFITGVILSLFLIIPLVLIYTRSLSIKKQIQLISTLNLTAYVSLYLYSFIQSRYQANEFTFSLLSFECILVAIFLQCNIIIRNPDQQQHVSWKFNYFKRFEKIPMIFVIISFSFQKLVAFAIIEIESNYDRSGALILIFCISFFTYLSIQRKSSSSVNSIFKRSVIIFYVLFFSTYEFHSLRDSIDSLLIDQFIFSTIVIIAMIFFAGTGAEFVIFFGRYYTRDIHLVDLIEATEDSSLLMYPTE
jgi:hypothetical protein